MHFNKTAISAAIVGSLAIGSTASASIITASFDGLFTLLDVDGSPLQNTDNRVAPWNGNRSTITGGLTFDTNTGTGTGTVAPFSFFGVGLATITTITFQAIGDGFGGPGTLILGNMGFNTNTNTGIGVSLVMDAAGLFGAYVGGLATVGDTVSGVGALPATDGILFGAKTLYTLPIGPSPMVSTTFNTTAITNTSGTTPLGTNPSGAVPLTDDGIGGSPIPNGPIKDTHVNIDITSIHIDSITTTTNPVPVPAAVWLFGSGLLGLVGVARRRKRS